jgi:hypothetical protein
MPYLITNLRGGKSMERANDKIPEYLLDMQESLLLAQLRAVRQLRPPKKGGRKAKPSQGMSNMDMAIDILRRARRPMHVSEIISQVKSAHGASLDRESLVSALAKKLHRLPGLSRTAPNTFSITIK